MHIAENSNRSTKPTATTGGDIDGQLSKYNTGQLRGTTIFRKFRSINSLEATRWQFDRTPLTSKKEWERGHGVNVRAREYMCTKGECHFVSTCFLITRQRTLIILGDFIIGHVYC